MLDKNALDNWGQSEHERLADQDEELLLGDRGYLSLILTVLDEDRYLPSKKNVLLEALCVILYDNISELNSIANETKKEGLLEEVNNVTKEFIKRKLLFKSAERELPKYLKTVVFPQIGINLIKE